MRSNAKWMSVLAMAGAVALCSVGCEDKSDPSFKKATDNVKSATNDAADKAVDAANKAGDAAKDAANKASDAVKDAAPSGH
jgi:hypothetical protein